LTVREVGKTYYIGIVHLLRALKYHLERMAEKWGMKTKQKGKTILSINRHGRVRDVYQRECDARRI
jgi:hypothetical protein